MPPAVTVVDPSNTLPVDSLSNRNDGCSLSQRMVQRLSELGITSFFAVQTAIIPFLLSDSDTVKLYPAYQPLVDASITAPTGSGKTLAYAVPIVEVLSLRHVICLRAVVVVPTRDLVAQVKEMFELISKGRGLKIGTATGHQSFKQEQESLIEDTSTNYPGGSSRVDILICTPGRLIDHLEATPNFTLQHLRFLVVDEADRLLSENFQDWLRKVIAALEPATNNASPPGPLDSCSIAPTHLPMIECDLTVKPSDIARSSCQKLLFSATMTQDPGKLSELHLRNVRHFVVGASAEPGPSGLELEKFELPAQLSEHYLVTQTEQKPIALFNLVLKERITNALIFTKSTESATRLSMLLSCFDRAKHGSQTLAVAAFSSDLNAQQRKSVLSEFRNGRMQILICSDIISRGLDIPNVQHVISYDAPLDMRKYVHRVGRTARAGRDGIAWTFVEQQEARYFKSMMREAGHFSGLRRVKWTEDDLGDLKTVFEDYVAGAVLTFNPHASNSEQGRPPWGLIGVIHNRASLSTKTRSLIQDAVKAHPLVLFMKGTPARPECGFSRAVIQAMEMNGVPEEKLKTFNVLEDPELRTGIKEFSDWPTIPQVYVGGEFIGGCDIVLGMHQSGELEKLLEAHNIIPKLDDASKRS